MKYCCNILVEQLRARSPRRSSPGVHMNPPHFHGWVRICRHLRWRCILHLATAAPHECNPLLAICQLYRCFNVSIVPLRAEEAFPGFRERERDRENEECFASQDESFGRVAMESIKPTSFIQRSGRPREPSSPRNKVRCRPPASLALCTPHTPA